MARLMSRLSPPPSNSPLSKGGEPERVENALPPSPCYLPAGLEGRVGVGSKKTPAAAIGPWGQGADSGVSIGSARETRRNPFAHRAHRKNKKSILHNIIYIKIRKMSTQKKCPAILSFAFSRDEK